jgi:acyl carrier protein
VSCFPRPSGRDNSDDPKYVRRQGAHVDRSDIISQLNVIIEDIIDEGPVCLSEATAPADVDGWDSLAHIQLVVAVEKHFDIKFTSGEILVWKNVGEMIDCILTKTSPTYAVTGIGRRD